jgi:DNA polymerase (family X)
MDNWEVAAALERMAGLLALKGETGYKARAYSQAARQIIRTPEPVGRLADQGRLEQLPGIGKALAQKIEELAATGQSTFLARLETEVSPELLALFSIPGIGYKTAATMVRELQLENMAQLEKAARAGRIKTLPGLGPAVEENVIRFLRDQLNRPEGFHRGVAVPLAGQLLQQLSGLPGVTRAEAAGEIRRGTELVTEVVVLAALGEDGDRSAFKEALWQLPGLVSVAPSKSGFSLKNVTGLPLRLVLVETGEYPAALAELTGSKAHWAALVECARDRGLLLSGRGLFEGDSRLPLRDEGQLYSTLGLTPVPPELRENTGELAAAAADLLPALVERAQIRGDLHLHTDWSDGTASISAMADAGAAAGYQYIAVTDHSPALQIAGGFPMSSWAARSKRSGDSTLAAAAAGS